MSNDIVERLRDLHKQATTENSHFYVAQTVIVALNEILALRHTLDYRNEQLYEIQRVLGINHAKKFIKERV